MKDILNPSDEAYRHATDALVQGVKAYCEAIGLYKKYKKNEMEITVMSKILTLADRDFKNGSIIKLDIDIKEK